MIAEKEQKELFEFEKPKRTFSGIGRIFSFPKSSFGITLSLERAIFISITIIMMMVVIYALGVERGKVLGRRLSASWPRQAQMLAPAVTIALPAKPTAQPIAAQGFTSPKDKTTIQPQAKDGSYTIVAATFSNKDAAQTEAERLKKNGFDAYLAKSDSYFQVRIGAYLSKEIGQKVLVRVRKIHKDAYFKLR